MSSKEPQREKPPYLGRIDELKKVSIVLLKGEITRDMIPVIEKRIQDNRRLGSDAPPTEVVGFLYFIAPIPTLWSGCRFPQIYLENVGTLANARSALRPSPDSNCRDWCRSKIEKNVLIDFAKVVDVDSATVAFHIIHMEEYHRKGFEVGFINLNEEMKALLEMFKHSVHFKVYPSEAGAVKELNS